LSVFAVSIPTIIDNPSPLTFDINIGQSVFVLGANGSGKSSLMHYFYTMFKNNSIRITAHRQTWLTSDSLELTPRSKRQQEQHIKDIDVRAEARWKDDSAAIRPNIAIYNLIDAENVRARAITHAVDNGDIKLAKDKSIKDEALLSIINELLSLSGLPITVSIHENDRMLAKKSDSEGYSIAELSDGERNALLISAAVLTAEPGSLILIDEPERHLHRSIISPLLTHLFARRYDYAFIVSTHEILLPIDHPDSKVLLVRSCSYQNKKVTGWQIDIVNAHDGMPEDIKFDIYGTRRKLLFIEGTEESLDKPLYGILFPEVSVIPKGNCRDVERSTIGIRRVPELHWSQAYGLIDRDGRGEEEQKKLLENGIYAIECYSVESIYYHSEMLNVVAKRFSSIDGSDPKKRVENAITVAIKAIQSHRDRLCIRVASRKVYEFVHKKIPKLEKESDYTDISINIPASKFIKEELLIFDSAIKKNDYNKLLQRYPLRETPALNRIVMKIGLKKRKEYEAAVLKACEEDENVRSFVISCLGDIGRLLNED
jgi:ABC-type cobalamin/Fe3+-siderophores transport system ATPase subunit